MCVGGTRQGRTGEGAPAESSRERPGHHGKQPDTCGETAAFRSAKRGAQGGRGWFPWYKVRRRHCKEKVGDKADSGRRSARASRVSQTISNGSLTWPLVSLRDEGGALWSQCPGPASGGSGRSHGGGGGPAAKGRSPGPGRLEPGQAVHHSGLPLRGRAAGLFLFVSSRSLFCLRLSLGRSSKISSHTKAIQEGTPLLEDLNACVF